VDVLARSTAHEAGRARPETFAASGIYSIPPECPFAEALVDAVLNSWGADPLSLSHVTLLLPSRRACVALRDLFARRTHGKAMLLPTLAPIGDVEPDELALHLFAQGAAEQGAGLLAPAAPALHRLLTLSELVWKFHAAAFGQDAPREHSVWLARELMRFLDEVEREELPLSALEKLVPDLYAEHWQKALTFLSVLSQHYEPLLRDQQLISPMHRRNRLLHAQAAHWKKHPPQHPVVIAGSTGTNPATAALMRAAMRLPQGYVVLPGLDVHMGESAWEKAGDTHPQYTLKLLLEHIGITRGDVHLLQADGACHPERQKLLSHVMLPAEETAGWPSLPVDLARALERVEYAVCDTVEEEAQIITLMLREVLETPEKTAALVTHDRALARRVTALLQRYGVLIDDSAGKPLTHTEAGAFFRLALEVTIQGGAPVPLLALLKHPLARVGKSAAECRRLARAIERFVLRGLRPAGGLHGIRVKLEKEREERTDDAELLTQCIGVMDALLPCFTELERLIYARAPAQGRLEEILHKHLHCVEKLSTDERGRPVLEEGEGGEALVQFVNDAVVQARVTRPVFAETYPGILEALMTGVTWRPAYGRHPRLHILSPMEARMQFFDRVVLGGLNEGSWPPAPDADPWMSRPMRAEFGLPSLEKKISQAAHDFMMQWQAPELLLTRAAKSGGAKTTENRWLTRLRAFVEGRGGTLTCRPWRGWLRQLQQAQRVAPVTRPEPRPPMEARPRSLYVTRVETLLRDPYGIYASHILGLHKLKPLDQEVDVRDFGNLVHEALNQMLQRYPDSVPDRDVLLTIGREVFYDVESQPAHFAVWWPRFERIAEWVLEQERERRSRLQAVYPERQGHCSFDAPGGLFTLKARADRIEQTKTGALAFIDYKTGMPPSQKEVDSGYSPQLPLEAVIAEQGGFTGIRGTAQELEYWYLKGTEEGGQVRALKNVAQLKEKAWQGIQALVALYDNPAQPYAACPRLDMKPRYNDYEHLERLDEWSAG
jgi:ATP-dependent helicase/nuclease subunit B